MSDNIAVISVVAYNDNRAIVFRRKKDPFLGMYCPITGNLNYDEPPGRAAIRETWEELYSISNLSVEDVVNLYFRHEFKHIVTLDRKIQNKNYKIYVYTCNVGKPTEFKLSEIEDPKYLDEVDISELDDITREYHDQILRRFC